jgi:rare lipoprotein A
VRINDRGILSKGRIIDLSYAAAQELKITKAGLAKVDVEVISLGRTHHKK